MLIDFRLWANTWACRCSAPQPHPLISTAAISTSPTGSRTTTHRGTVQRGVLGRTNLTKTFLSSATEDGSRMRGWGAWQIAGRFSRGDFSDGPAENRWWYRSEFHLRPQLVVEPVCPYAVQLHQRRPSESQRDTATTGGGAMPAGVPTSEITTVSERNL